MRAMVAAAIAALVLMPVGAQAGERAGDAVLGALSGALVLGPVGAAAGAVIGYTAGPGIARSWGLGGHRRYRGSRRARSGRTGQAGRGGRAASNAPAAAATGPGDGGKKRGDWYNVTR